MGQKLQVALCALLQAAIISVSAVQADPLTPSQVLRVTFVLPETPFPFGTPDTLVFVVDVTRVQPFGTFSALLRDRHDPLGTYSTSVNGETSGGGLGIDAFFLSSTSTYRVPDPFGPPAIIDFASLADRSIQGTLELSIATGVIDVRPDTAHFFLGRSTSRGSFQGTAATNPVITSVEVSNPIPEPATIWLIGSGLAAAALARRRSRRGHSPNAGLPGPAHR